MTTIVTASFREWRQGMGQPVSIALAHPRDMPEAGDWPVCHLLTPRWSYFRAAHDEFDRQYVAQLERFGAKKIACCLAAISRQAGHPDRLVLLCHESSAVAESRCHRRLLAQWWLLATGERWPEITELDGRP